MSARDRPDRDHPEIGRPEFSRPFAVSAVGAHGAEVVVEASAAERAALASRFGLPAIEALSCRFRLSAATGGCLPAECRLQARIVQDCVISLEPFETALDEAFRVRFVPEARLSDDPDPQSEDEIAIVGGVIDLGEAAAEQLALGLDPYPRQPGVALAGQDDAAPSGPSGPFAALRPLPRDD